MITGELKSKVDRVWLAFYSGGISNPLDTIEQITYLLFLRRLDELQTAQEALAQDLGRPVQSVVPGPLGEKRLRWGALKNLGSQEMFEVVSEEVFPHLRRLGGETTYGHHMKDARFTIPTAALLGKVVDLLDDIPMENRDTNGDLYEYLLSKISSAGTNGQFRTPRHIIELMVDLMAPKPNDVICDPACGTAAFLVGAGEYLRERHKDAMFDPGRRQHFHHGMFHGYDFDSTMLRIGSMNMLLHGVEAPDIRYRDSLSDGAAGDKERYTLVLANPPFKGSLDADAVATDLKGLKTKKTELLFLGLILRLLESGGRAAVIVPDGVLFGATKAHKELRRQLVEEQKLDAVVKLPSGVFKPYAGVSTAILFFTKTNSGQTDHVWFYDVQADGFSLDDKRNPIQDNDLDDVRERWAERDGAERERARTEQSFTVPKADIVEQGYDLSINRYKELVFEEVEHRDPLEIIADIEALEEEIRRGREELKGMLS